MDRQAPMQCEQIRELLEGYALGTLDAHERAQVASHLATCAECRRLANEYADVVSMMPPALAAASPLRVPADMKNRVLQSVAAESATGVRPAPRRQMSTTETTRSWFAWLNLRTVGAIVALIMLIGTFAWALQLNTEVAQARALRAEYANLVNQQETVLEVIDSNKTVKAILKSPLGDSPAYGKLFTRPDLPNVVVMAARLPQPLSGQSYRLWLTRGGQMRLIGPLTIDSNGFGIIVFDANQKGPVYEAARLILQPDSATTPDGTVVLTWDATKSQ